MARVILDPWGWQDECASGTGVAVRIGSRMLVCAGQPYGGVPVTPVALGGMRAQVNLALNSLEAALREAGMTLANVVRLSAYTTDADELIKELAIGGRLERPGCRPALGVYEVGRLGRPDLMVALEATAIA